MSLVIAYIGSGGSVVAGDMREIILWGDSAGSKQFEDELYSGRIGTDDEMHKRAASLGVHLRVRDTKRKVRERDDVLIGEVSDFEYGLSRRRRLYVTRGRYALVEIEGSKVTHVQRGEAGRFVVLGSPFIQQTAHQFIHEHWKGMGVQEASKLLADILALAARSSPSVSREYTILQTVRTVDLESLIERASEEFIDS